MKCEKVRALVRFTVKEGLRNKLLLALLLLSVVIFFGAIMLGRITVDDTARGVFEFGHFVIFIGIAAISVVYPIFNLRREIETRVYHTTLGLGFTRSEFLFGKFIGYTILSWLIYVIISLLFVISIKMFGTLPKNFFTSIYGLFIEIPVIVAISTVIAALSSGTIIAIFLATTFVIIGHVVGLVLNASRIEFYMAQWKVPALILSFVFPVLDYFNLEDFVLAPGIMPWHYYVGLAAYALFYVMAFLGFGIWRFEDKDLL